MSRITFAWSVVRATVASLLLTAQAGAAETKIAVAVIGMTASNWSGIVAREKGFFRDEGLDVEWVSTGQSAKAAQSVIAGATQMGSSSMADTVRAIDAGGNLVVFANSLARGIHELIAAPDLKSVADLKGRRVIIGGQKDVTALWWNAMARHYNLDPRRDVQLVYAGSTSSRMTALASGAVEAAALAPPASFEAIDHGYADLGPMAGYLGDFPMMIYHVSRTWAVANRDRVVAFVKAEDRAARYILDSANKQEVSAILAAATGSAFKDALRTYDVVIKANGVAADSSISEATVNTVVEALAAAGDLKDPGRAPASFFDPQYVEAANRLLQP